MATREELVGLVAYADARGVTLVPEIEMPGHSSVLVAEAAGQRSLVRAILSPASITVWVSSISPTRPSIPSWRL